MMNAEWRAVLARYGQSVTVTAQGVKRKVKAFMQPVLDRDDQLAPSPLGLRREERCLYLGPADCVLVPRESLVAWNGQEFDVHSTRSVGDGHHIWAILVRREGEA